MGRMLPRIGVVLLGIPFVGILGAPASAATDGEVTPAYRTEGTTLLVCGTDRADLDTRVAAFPDDLRAANVTLWEQCQTGGFRDLQTAVDQVTQPGVIIKILPGVYQDPATDTDGTAQTQTQTRAGLVSVIDKQDLQIEGTGALPDDVVLDAGFGHPTAIGVEQSPGLYLRNLTAQQATVAAVSVTATDGFVLDTLVGRWSDGSGLAANGSDHGLLTGCEAYGNGDAGLRVDGSDPARFPVEIVGCHSHDNLQGFAGTGSVWAHDNVFDANSVGFSAGTEPGVAQRHSLVELNVISDNNSDYYGNVAEGTCAQPSAQRGYQEGTVCPATAVPPGTGVLSLGGDDNTWRGNWIYGNDRVGVMSGWLPGYVRGDRSFTAQFDTSHHNVYFDNTLGTTPAGDRAPNGMDFWWDGQGTGSCWQRDGADGSEPLVLPLCNADGLPAGLGTARYAGEAAAALTLRACLGYDLATAAIPTDCDWFGATGLHRIEVKWALGEAVLLGLTLILLVARVLKRSRAALVGLVVTLAGLGVGVLGTWWVGSIWTPIGLGLAGFGWLLIGTGLYRSGRPGRGFITLAMGVFALLGALDRGVVMIPYIPVPPSLWRIMIEGCWVPIALWTAIRNKRLRRGGFPSSDDALARYTAQLRF